MASTLATLRSKLRTQLKIDPQKNVWTDSTLDGYINQGRLQLQRDGNFEWQENTGYEQEISLASGTQEYALNTDIALVDLVQVGDSSGDTGRNNLSRSSKVGLLATKKRFTNGKPNEYYTQQGNIGFSPIPNQVYTATIQYRKKLDRLTTDDDSNIYDEDFDAAIVNYAAYLAWSGYRGSANSGLNEKEQYDEAIGILKQSYLVFDQSEYQFTTMQGGLQFGTTLRGSNE